MATTTPWKTDDWQGFTKAMKEAGVYLCSIDTMHPRLVYVKSEAAVAGADPTTLSPSLFNAAGQQTALVGVKAATRQFVNS
jgi:hypothetical protein